MSDDIPWFDKAHELAHEIITAPECSIIESGHDAAMNAVARIILRAIHPETEWCAKIAEESHTRRGIWIAAAIRARGKT